MFKILNFFDQINWENLRTWPVQQISYNKFMLQNNPHNATETT